MTDFRSPDQVQSDLRRLNPNFSSVARSNDLLQLLSDQPMAEASAAMTGNGPVLFNLGVLNGPEWQGVRAFLDSRHVSAAARRDFQGLEADLRAADTNNDGFVNNQELVAFATSHTARWNTVAAFRSAAEAYLNRLPSYIAQPNLTSDQVGKLYGIMNYYAEQWRASGADPSRWGTVMGLSLQGFPSTDTANAPALIQRASRGELTPQESAAVHRLLAISRNGSELNFNAAGSDAPLRPEEIGMLGQILEGANGHTFQGMTIVSGEAERAFFSPRNDAARAFQASLNAARGGLNLAPPEGGWREGDQIVINGGAPIAAPTGDASNRAVLLTPDQFNATGANTVRVVRAGADLSSVSHRVRVDAAAVGAAFANARTTFAPFDTDHPEQISASTLLARAYAGDLNPVEAGALRVWMRSEAEAQGRTCSGTLDCLRLGAMRFFRNIARDPLHFLARNGGMVASAYLYRRFVLKNVVENRLNQLCGGAGADPNAYRNYEKFVQDQMRQSGLLKNVASRVASNPYVAMAVFNMAVAPAKDTGNLPVDMLTDLPLVPLMFHGMDTLSAFNSPMINRFAGAGAGAGACRPSDAAQSVPAPQAVTAAAPAPADARSMTQTDFQNAMAGLAAPALTPLQIASLPTNLQGLFTEDIIWGAGQWEQQQVPLINLIPANGATSPIAEALVQRYAADNPTLAARIRADIPQITAVFRQSDGQFGGSISSSRTNSVRWALRQYIGNLQDGFEVPVSTYVPLIRDGGLVQSYFGIRESQASIQSTSNLEHRDGISRLPETVDFAYAARSHWQSVDTIAYNRAHPQPVSPRSSEAGEPYGLRNAEGQPIIFIPLPTPGAAVGLFELLFGGAAAAESAPAIGYGVMALSGA